MTLYLQRDTGEVRDDNNTLIGTIDGPRYHVPDDVAVLVRESFPNDQSSVSVEDLLWTLDAATNDIEYGTPP